MQPKNTESINSYIKIYGFKLGAELGVRKGEFVSFLCRANSFLSMICVDLWGPHPSIKSLPGERAEDHEKNYLETLKNFAPFEKRIRIIIIL